MLLPKKTKYRKAFRGKMRGLAQKGNKLILGDWGVQALSRGLLSSRQIEAARKSVMHYTERGGKLLIRVFPDKPISKKPAETRMGGGKSAVDHYAAVVRPGRIIFEVAGLPKEMAQEALKLASAKLPLKVRIVKKQ
ncbi:50S ribosomal protein L16 [candidate division WWE3 bacterium RIFCSPHIGHO2_01_FULL_48_15]|uniref:Large ribosomal subunit protein uL16 n=1 Tax=candidate division WWE3 bacterium RIFCSPHIGHO2_01_FULL_48_15 TaxID=1802619 RepID=A0A1F4VBA2_UNCKA|nr:MAG: 50S ribosomal protein L16 [candidate division WWE3 bacterium RIFCSPHIGHO2_01_FULL_48_15]